MKIEVELPPGVCPDDPLVLRAVEKIKNIYPTPFGVKLTEVLRKSHPDPSRDVFVGEVEALVAAFKGLVDLVSEELLPEGISAEYEHCPDKTRYALNRSNAFREFRLRLLERLK